MDNTLLLILVVVGMGGFMFWSQWRARKRYREQMEQLEVGDRVVTIGGIYGRLTLIDRQENKSRLEIAPGVEIEIGLNAIAHSVPPGEE